jgi:hypothetical protein
MSKQKVLIYDIENTPTVVTTWGLWEQNAIETLEEWYIMSVSWKWLGEKETHVIALPDFKGYSKDKKNDKNLCIFLRELFDEADVLVAHNGDEHDQKKSNARFIYNGLTPPSPYKTIDTKKIAKRYFKFNSNSLNNLGTYLKLGNKIENSGIKLWRACMNGDLKAWSLMKKYNKQDVVLLEKVYNKLMPWAKNTPILHIGCKCGQCGSDDLQFRGWTYQDTGKTKRRRLCCNKCHRWSLGSLEKVI